MLDEYILWLKTDGKSKKTVNEYPMILQKLMKWYEETEGNEFQPDKVTTLHIHEFVTFLDKIVNYEPAYINKILASLKTFYKYALEKGLVIYNPMLKVKMKRTMKQYAAPKWLSKQEASKFFHAIEQEKNEKQKARDMAVCRLMAGAGLRVHEVSDLNISDICIEKRKESVTVRRGKGGKFRIVPLNSDVVESLESFMKYRENTNMNSHEPLFLSERNTRLSDRTIRHLVTKYAYSSKLDDVSPHTLRHTFCKNLADQGYGLQIIAQLAGHESLETTRRYTQPGNNDLRRAVQTISEKR
ncbi:tyrosine-type recombinase/integrase [Pseudobacteroides cellulosolvens]|uniref:Integrase family protein n=1 Tax=Pseudobacteroides cellulosolvens ATCC 35603 = DSM 2933 TaxID=398512 RepID=A0A0L6JPD9_9FIRM|nr:tyrosine-type recombinase/integrase [Pseudobacteroides cellulosolvens]KNY27580.1 integrase family protein [Pseudobacteroides cellulosolvens ATCC 35603 = DSM 2933]